MSFYSKTINYCAYQILFNMNVHKLYTQLRTAHLEEDVQHQSRVR